MPPSLQFALFLKCVVHKAISVMARLSNSIRLGLRYGIFDTPNVCAKDISTRLWIVVPSLAVFTDPEESATISFTVFRTRLRLLIIQQGPFIDHARCLRQSQQHYFIDYIVEQRRLHGTVSID